MNLTEKQYNELRQNGYESKCYGADIEPFSAFGEAVYITNSYDEIKDFKTTTVDISDCETWEIEPEEWYLGIQEAIENAMFWYEDNLD